MGGKALKIAVKSLYLLSFSCWLMQITGNKKPPEGGFLYDSQTVCRLCVDFILNGANPFKIKPLIGGGGGDLNYTVLTY
ncbi:hypothetical protein DFP77_1432 [Marinomonas foliarum]|uniref:Uncharacterized protein n=1 Tax=Marinomonas foliarum TaxID=491950 RepID=A0A368ZLK4_9GAMM|nr:hypothetical protein DFP77_1432 [Marinomonas foliarum]